VKTVAVVLVRGHRALLVASTASLAIAASRIAADPGLTGSWISLVASSLLLYVADVLAEVDSSAVTLSKSAGHPASKTRWDVFEANMPRLTVPAILLAIGLMLGGFILDGLS